jgi:hypothetical protein
MSERMLADLRTVVHAQHVILRTLGVRDRVRAVGCYQELGVLDVCEDVI